MNPYAKFLAGKQPLDVIKATPEALASIAGKLGPSGLERSYAPGKWTARSIFCHLADTEVAFAFRIRQALAETEHVIQPFDQDLWSQTYPSLKAEAALDAFSALRRWNVALLGTLPEKTHSKPLRHPERGPMVFLTLIETMAGHDLNHLGQLNTIAQQG